MRAVLTLTLLLALAPSAHASIAQVYIADSCGADVACGKYDAGHDVPVVTYLASAGEANRLTVSRAGDEWTLSDPGAPVTAGEGCRGADAHTVVCTAASQLESIPGFIARLGDGEDALTVSGALRVSTFLDGGLDADVISGGDERDTIDGGAGADRIEGGVDDTLTFADRLDGLTVDLRRGRTSDGDRLRGIHRVEGTQAADSLQGSPQADTLLGNAGNDTIGGGGGDDELEGGVGVDTVEGGAGDDRVSGDPPQGDDYYTPRIRLHADILRGGPGDDLLSDSGGANRFEGGPGDDLVAGGSGPDRVFGGPGADQLFGHGGPDRLFGQRGEDDLRGGTGADLLSGGPGADRLQCGSGRDSARLDARDRVRACEKRRSRGYTPSG